MDRNMTLKEMLSSPEAKKMYRELAKKYHPDFPGGSASKMKDINKAKDEGDYYLKKLYKELTRKAETETTTSYSDVETNIDEKYEILKKWAEVLERNLKLDDQTIFILLKKYKDKIDAVVSYVINVENRKKTGSFTIPGINKIESNTSFRMRIMARLFEEGY
jgi:hypothetical protein